MTSDDAAVHGMVIPEHLPASDAFTRDFFVDTEDACWRTGNPGCLAESLGKIDAFIGNHCSLPAAHTGTTLLGGRRVVDCQARLVLRLAGRMQGQNLEIAQRMPMDEKLL